MKITVVIPTYNEAENLPELASALFSLPLSSLDLLIVDDNSPDGTGQVADDLAQEYPGRVFVLHRAGKLGFGSAYITGFKQALDNGAEIVVQMDADFSHNPERVVDLVKKLEECDMALGSRYVEGGDVDEGWAFWRKGLSYFGNFYTRLILGLPIRDITGGFRAWRRETLLGIALDQIKSNGYVFQVEMAYSAHQCGYTIMEVPIYFKERRWGESKMSFKIQLEAAVRVWAIRFSGRDAKKYCN